jgi:hypothetical protein
MTEKENNHSANSPAMEEINTEFKNQSINNDSLSVPDLKVDKIEAEKEKEKGNAEFKSK